MKRLIVLILLFVVGCLPIEIVVDEGQFPSDPSNPVDPSSEYEYESDSDYEWGDEVEEPDGSGSYDGSYEYEDSAESEWGSGEVESDIEIIEGETAYVVNVLDGDTIDVEINGEEYRVRYVGVDTPERDEPFYDIATQYNWDLVMDQTVTLVQDVSDTDQYGRLLRYVYLQDNTFVNAELIMAGYARVVTFPPDVSMTDFLAELQGESRSEQRGLWGQNEFMSGETVTGCLICTSNFYDCADFDTQSQAQSCYDYCFDERGTDVHNLDGGGDGLVCESLP